MFCFGKHAGGFLHRQGGVTLCYKIYGGGGFAFGKHAGGIEINAFRSCFLKMNIVCVEPSV